MMGRILPYIVILILSSGDLLSKTNPLIPLLKERRDLVSSWVSECKTAGRQGEISDFHNECLQKDTLSWAGYTCFASTLAQDNTNSFKRCLDVKNSQGLDGRWWRGPGKTNKEEADSFSRDMSLGLASWLLATPQNGKESFLKWLHWIEYSGKGRMCLKASDSRCDIKGNQKNVFKALLNEYRIHESSAKDYKIVKKFNEGYSLNLFSTETDFTPVGYQLHLKAIEILILKRLQFLDNDNYLSIANKIYEKDPLNPFYEYLYRGINPRLVDRVFLMCPSSRNLLKSVRHRYGGDWIWQRDMRERSWEIANGHDCIFLMNLMISELEGRLTLPRVMAKVQCLTGQMKLGLLEGYPICAPLIPEKMSSVECKNISPIQWTKENKQWCLQFDSGRWKALTINKTCPNNQISAPDTNGYSVCEDSPIEKIRLFKCVDSYQSALSDKPSPITPSLWCYLNKGQWFEKKMIDQACPAGYVFKNKFVWEIWPLCQGLSSKSDCNGQWDIKSGSECWVRKDGWFELRDLK
jgi:hypothetical protein